MVFILAGYVRKLPHDYVTLPEAMKAAGYATFFAGKWHLGGEGSWPTDHGFDINVGGWEVGSPQGGFFAPWENPNLESGRDGENLTMRLARETADFIRANEGRPFFAFLSFYAVHAPIQTTEGKWRKYRDKAEAMGIAESGFEMGRYLPIRQEVEGFRSRKRLVGKRGGAEVNRAVAPGLAVGIMITLYS